MNASRIALFTLALISGLQSGLLAADTKAEALRTPPPEYPANLRQSGVSGTVVVKLSINAEGKVQEAEIVKSNESRLETHALKAVRKWVFKPATKDGVGVSTAIVIPIQFSLES